MRRFVFSFVVIILVVLFEQQELKCSLRAPGYFTNSMTRLHLPHAIVVKLHAHYIDVFILTPETAEIFGVTSSSLSLRVGYSIQNEAMKVAQGSLPCGRYLLAPLTVK